LKHAGVHQDIEASLVPMAGRMIHDLQGSTSLQAYGGRPDELIYSISRHRLSAALLDIAVRRHGVKVHFEHRLEATDFETGIATIRALGSERLLRVPMQPLLACDGGGSRLRRNLQEAHLIESQELMLDHSYKELSVPPAAAGAYAMRREALHIWPRGNHMLIALPNDDGSFTATLFLPNEGGASFASLHQRDAIDAFLNSNFPDAVRLMPNRLDEFDTHATGLLGTVYAQPWHWRGMAALIGDAAHAIVPFHGQGMNCCFEDCVEFEDAVASHPSWEARFQDFFARRKPNTDAIAAISLENYLEMRAHVSDAGFKLRHALALELERRFPQRFIPRYAMVMFHHEIPYSVAFERGRIQTRLLEDLTKGIGTLDAVDFARAKTAIDGQLPPIASIRSKVTKE
jgi:kynurenine 3-monooxygenase